MSAANMYLYQDQFLEKHDYPTRNSVDKTLIIASTARCGSHMLGHALHKTNCFGYPLEYANSANLAEWKRRFDTKDFSGVISEIQRRRTSPNGVFGIKVHYSHIKNIGGLSKLMKTFTNPHFILLSRKDVLAQAVSLSIASQTGAWISGQKSVKHDPKYNFNHINRCLRSIIIDNSSWRYILSANGCKYIEMNFENVRDNLAESIYEIEKYCDVEVGSASMLNEQATKKQSNDINKKWMTKFIYDSKGEYELLEEKGFTFLDKIERNIKVMFGR